MVQTATSRFTKDQIAEILIAGSDLAERGDLQAPE